jgi:hypothetical protein
MSRICRTGAFRCCAAEIDIHRTVSTAHANFLARLELHPVLQILPPIRALHVFARREEVRRLTWQSRVISYISHFA